MLGKLSTNRKISTSLLLIILIAAIVSCSRESGLNPTDEGSKIPSAVNTPVPEAVATATVDVADENLDPSSPTYQVGEIIEKGDIVLSVLGWNIHEGFGETYIAEEGDMLLTVDVVLVNRGSEAISILTSSHMGLKNNADRTFDIEVKALVASGSYSPAGEIGPGERIRGKAGFQVPQDSTGMTFIFNGDDFNAGEILVELASEPGTLPPPDRLPGELPPKTWNVGETAALGGLNVTVNDVIPFEGSELYQPLDGMRYIAVDVTMENIHLPLRDIVDPHQIYLKDSTGQKYDFDATGQMLLMTEDLEHDFDFRVPQGESVRGLVAFQVPEDIAEFVFVVDVSIFEPGKIFIRLVL